MQALLESEPVVKQRGRGRRAGVGAAPAESAPAGADRWEQRFAELVAFKSDEGHCNVPSSYRQCPSLAVWVFNCRRQRKQGLLAESRIARLDAIGFAWEVRTRRIVARDWDDMISQLQAFRREHGHCDVPHAAAENRELAAWLHGVRCNKRSGRLDVARVRQLDALGLTWDPQQSRWEEMFAALSEYRKLYGDCNVPVGWARNPALARWVKGLRAAQKRGGLDAARVRRLDAIDFGWERGGDARWDEMFAALADFARANGHCRVSTLAKEGRALGNWVHTQRTLHKQGRLEPERIARLQAIGFTWDLRRERWEEMLAALDEFRRLAGHCDVPQSFAGNRKLGNWVMVQRAAYKAGRLDGEQIERLAAVGFRFSLAGDRLLVARPSKARPAARPDKRRAA